MSHLNCQQLVASKRINIVCSSSGPDCQHSATRSAAVCSYNPPPRPACTQARHSPKDRSSARGHNAGLATVLGEGHAWWRRSRSGCSCPLGAEQRRLKCVSGRSASRPVRAQCTSYASPYVAYDGSSSIIRTCTRLRASVDLDIHRRMSMHVLICILFAGESLGAAEAALK